MSMDEVIRAQNNIDKIKELGELNSQERELKSVESDKFSDL